MCGIAGIIYKKPQNVGKAIYDMLEGIQHRGPDSTGIAVYGEEEEVLKIWVYLYKNNADVKAQITSKLQELGGTPVDYKLNGQFVLVRVKYDGSVKAIFDGLETIPGVHIISLGSSLEVFKYIGLLDELESNFNVTNYVGTHGIGHVRMATESEIDVRTAHPFWAGGYNNIAIVHNGQLTDYYKMRRSLEQKGNRFNTGNDSELVSVYIAYQISQGHTLKEALEMSVDDFDGTFTYLVSSLDGVGFAKDRLGAKPLIVLETEEAIAFASEEVALRKVFPVETKEERIYEPGPGEVMTWSR